MVLVDTNVLIDYPSIVEDTNFQVCISIFVLEELDKLKRSQNHEVAKRARKASNLIKKNKNFVQFDSSPLNRVGAQTVDDGLVKLAIAKGYQLVTNDINLQLKCEIFKVPYVEYTPSSNEYSGILNLYVGKDDELIQSIYSEKDLTLYKNQYIIIRDGNEIKDIRVNRSNKIIPISYCSIKSNYNKEIKSKNCEQSCLLDALNSSCPIVCCLGTFGTGKSFLMTNYAIEQLEKGKIDKIVYIPNNSQVENSEEIGTLPGELIPKITPYIGTLIDIMGLFNVEKMVDSGQIEVIPIAFARGRNLENSIVIVNEAQNLTEDHVKLLLGRCAQGTRIFFDGDLKQEDKDVFRDRSGLRLLMNLRKSEEFAELFSVIKLEKTERSKTAAAAQYLDEIQ